MTATTWNFDNTHSSVGFSVRHMMFAKVHGRFTQWTGSLQLDEADFTKSSLSVEIDAASIDTGNEQRDGHLKSADFFDVEKQPKLTFASTRIERTGEGSYAVHGDLTIRGVTKAVVLETTDEGGGKDPWGNQRRGFSAKTKISRGEFGLQWNQALEAGGVLVSDEVTITVDVQVVKAQSQQVA